MTQHQILAKLLSRKSGATALEIIQRVGTVCPHKRMSDLKAIGWTIAKRLRIEDECMEVVDVYERFNEGYTLNDASLVTVRRFIGKLGMHEVIAAMERAYTNAKIRKGQEFKYFCGICWNKIREVE